MVDFTVLRHHYPGLLRLWGIFPQARLVGGCVRDMLIGAPVSDIDMATPDTPDDILQELGRNGITAIPTGIAHGTVTAVINKCPYEITTLRRDITTDGRHALVEWTSDWQEDAARRDFTINALYCDSDGRIYDYFNGQEDLRARRVRFVGHPRKRIEEDALRILRFFRFHARFGQPPPDPEAISAITEAAGHLLSLSVERVWSETSRIFTGPRSEDAVVLMEACGLWPRILRSPARVGGLLRLMHTGCPGHAVLYLLALAGSHAREVARHLKLSRAEIRYLGAVMNATSPEPGWSDARLRVALSDASKDILLASSWLEQARRLGRADRSWDDMRRRLLSLSVPVFPISGSDVMERGYVSGPEVGDMMRCLRSWWKENDCLPDRNACLVKLRQMSRDR